MKNNDFKYNLTLFDQPQTTLNVGFTVDSNDFILSFPTTLQQLPEKVDLSRSIGLWENECYELFLATNSAPQYYEFNFSCDYRWNCFRFEKYRGELQESSDFTCQAEYKRADDGIIYLQATLQNLSTELFNLIQISAVRMKNGDPKYFALKHSEGKADFHDKKCFQSLY